MSVTHADLTGLLRAELGTKEVSATGEHLRGCLVCRDDLAEAAVGHALLARSARTLGPDAAEATGARSLPDALAHPVSVLAAGYLTGRSFVGRYRGTLRWKGREVR